MIISFKNLEETVKTSSLKKVVLAVAEEADSLKAIINAALQNIVEPILIGDKEAITQIAVKEKLDIYPFKIIDATGEKEAAQKSIEMVKEGKADLLMKGKLSTAAIMTHVLDKEKGIRGSGFLSHISIIEIPMYHKLLIASDVALSISPDLKEKISIINNAVKIANKLGIQNPKVAVLGAVEKVNSAMPATIDAALLSKMADRGQIKGCTIDGPFALDNAVSKKSCEIKGIISEVGGDADILLMPDIEAGNIFYKTIAYLTDYKMAGIITGANVPIILTSRSDSNTTKYLSILAGVSLV